MSTGTFWIVILSVALGTFTLRSIPLWLHGRTGMPPWLERVLRYVPAAAMASLVIPGSLWVKSNGTYSASPERLVAIAIAALVAWRWRNMLATLIAGMVALWLLQLVV